MSEQALETEDKIETEETEIIEESAEEKVAEVEIVVDGEDEPPSETVPLSTFLKTKEKLNSKLSAKDGEVSEAQSEAAMLREEVKLLASKLEAKETLKRPKPEDFETDELFEAALDAYDDQRLDQKAEKKLAEKLAEAQTQVLAASQEEADDISLKAHYKRAAEMKLPNFEELEDKAIDILGSNLTKFIIANTENSEVILAHLGTRTERARELAGKLESAPGRLAVEIGELSKSLSVKPKTINPLDPPAEVTGGPASDTNVWERRLEKAREEAAATRNMTKLQALKKAAREAGVTL